MGFKKVLAVAMMISLVLVSLAGCGGATTGDSEQEIKEIKIGVLGDITGPGAPAGGLGIYQGMEVALEMINERGGVFDNYKIVPVVGDTQSNPEEAVREAKRLVEEEGVSAVLGGFISGTAMAASDFFEDNKVVYWVGTSAADELLRDVHKEYTFRASITSSLYGRNSVDFINDNYDRFEVSSPEELKVAVTYEDSPFGTAIALGALERLERFNMQVVANESYPTTSTDLTDVVSRVKDAEPDVILNVGYNEDTFLFLKTASELELKTKAIIGSPLYKLSILDVRRELGEEVAKYLIDISTPVPYELDEGNLRPGMSEITEEFLHRIKEKYPNEPSYAIYNVGFAIAWIFLDEVLPIAIEKYGEVTSETLRKASAELNIPERGTTIGYGVRFLPSDDTNAGQNERAFCVASQWNGEDWELIWPESMRSTEPIIPIPNDSPFGY